MHNSFREFPLDWMKRHIEKAGLRVSNVRNLSILHRYNSFHSTHRLFSNLPILLLLLLLLLMLLHSEHSILRQVNVARSKLPLIAQQPGGQMLKAGMEDYLNNLEYVD